MDIISPHEALAKGLDKAEIGGKAFHLIEVQQADLPVPPFLLLPRRTLAFILRPIRSEIEAICKNLAQAPEAEIERSAQQLQQLILSIDIAPEILSPWQKRCQKAFGADYHVAVRSSGIGEDGANVSFAGIHHTDLYVNEAGLTKSILKSIASAWDFPALVYRKAKGLPLQNIQYAIVIQQMIPAVRSGIGFSMNLQGNLADMLMVAGYGLGEGIVSDQVETDSYIVNRQSQSVRRRIQQKELQMVFSANSGVQTQALSEERRHQSVLNDQEILALSDLLFQTEQLLQQPADIEFSYDAKGKLYLLQMRPISTIQTDQLHILDNTNIVESYPGVTLPLSFSFALNAYEQVFKGASRAFWVSDKKISGYSEVLSNLLAHAYGRVYYRLDNWYRMMALVYSSKSSLDAWEKAVGLLQTERHKVQFSLRNKLKTLLSIIWLVVNYRAGNRRFFKLFAKNYRFMQDYEAHKGDAKALWDHYEEASQRLFKPWYLTLINDFLAFKAFGWMQDLVKGFGVSAEEEFANDLLCGMGGVDSEEAVLNVLRFKEQILASASLNDLFQLPAEEVLVGLQKPAFTSFKKALDTHLQRFGDRTLAELKLEVPSMRANPILFIRLIQNQLKANVRLASFEERQAQIRHRASARLMRKLPWRTPQRWLFQIVWKVAAYGLKNRENMRLCRTRGYGAVKDIFLAIGDCLQKEDILNQREDVFYLSLAELEALSKGDKRSAQQATIKNRQQEYATYANLDLPDRIIYEGEELPHFETKGTPILAQEGLYRGMAVSKGSIEAEAIVVSEPALDIPIQGKILISRMTDPGWVFLMTQAAGLISEKGSLLSHTAIVGRELGIPVVVGIPSATQIFANGDRLRLNGSEGTVELLKS
ncbi:MAG: PEP/pyruvate-binding domain-containing protein [Bacteroidota bacterium]